MCGRACMCVCVRVCMHVRVVSFILIQYIGRYSYEFKFKKLPVHLMGVQVRRMDAPRGIW